MSKLRGWREVKLKNSKILPWGLNVEVTQCSVEDINWAFQVEAPNQLIKKASCAVHAAEFFDGEWCIEENGVLVRPSAHVSMGEGVEFKHVALNPIDPQTNLSALNIFFKIGDGTLLLRDASLSSVSLSSTQCIMADKDGFCLWEVRQEY